VPVSFNIQDPNGLSNAVVNIYNSSNTTLLGTCGTASNLGGVLSHTINCNIDVSSYADNTYTLRGGGFDVAGNNRTITTTFVVDRTAPVSTFAGLVTADSTPALSGNSDDATAVEVEINGITTNAVVSGNTWNIPDNTVLPLPIGTYDVTINATDSLGNTSSTVFPNSLAIELASFSPTVLSANTDNSSSGNSNQENTQSAVVVTQVSPVPVTNTSNNSSNSGNSSSGEEDQNNNQATEESNNPAVLQSNIDNSQSQDREESATESEESSFIASNWWWILLLFLLLGGGGYYYYSGRGSE
jgi:hypothetical protein